MPSSLEAKAAAKPHPLSTTALKFGLSPGEFFWRDHQTWLADSGYMLRSRYRLDWEPSWLKSKNVNFFECEDVLTPMRTVIMDAIRVSDGRIVVLKRVPKSTYPDEEEYNRFLSMSEPQASDPHNHSVPVYDILQSPLDEDIVLLVMPYLIRIDELKFATVGEAVECFRQLFEGLQFLHHHHIAHLDIHKNNIMMDPTPVFSYIPHPTHSHKSYDFKHSISTRTRTSHPTKYFYIDFGFSWRLRPDDPSPRVGLDIGGDRSVPEYEDRQGRHDPYKVDVYCLGNIIRQYFMDKSRSLEFLRPIITEMVQQDPAERPSIDKAFEQFEQLRASVSPWTLRSRMVYEDELPLGRLYRGCRHAVRTAFWMATGKPALPNPDA
ncbi:hypothetical protein GSI_01651 [Ganoderma sinense ZZ0214-1]|uniref:Protein kinase domain-containing protein n=1 Tax=Ganoderma sinense ZZ0214-1 TaxID=1077348 RepID=A0A2G8SQE4_9APHY|nr:hypothetical protein GSI_01651 [Ganoderma sinense ZZ0214-1]